MQDDRVRHILVPVDTEMLEVSSKAMRRAAALARADSSRVTLMTVVPAWREDLAEVPPETEAAMKEAVEGHFGGVETQTLVKVGGSISGRIIQTVDEIGCDMVIMASHDPRMSDFLIGSNAAHVALHVPVTVIVVR